MIEKDESAGVPEGTSPALMEPLALPNGAVLRNRLAKAAMSEQLATRAGNATDALVALYGRWAHSGAGLLITGNAAVDRAHRIEPYNVVVDTATDVGALERWAASARSGGAHVWLQLNHPGRQAVRAVVRRSVAPSARRSRYWFLFAPPRALAVDEIRAIVERYGRAARIAEGAGFTGVQVHGAHGYLISQFLSPRSNERTDEWGGPLANRMRFLLEIVRSIRSSVAPSTAVSVKLNSADFQRGGFEFAEALAVIDVLGRDGVDLVELTGGNYESPRAFDDVGVRRSTREREAFFLEYARAARAVAAMPIMLTGGFRTVSTMGRVVRHREVDIVGLARAMAVAPGLPAGALRGDDVAVPRPRRHGIAPVDLLLESAWHSVQLSRMGAGKDPSPGIGAVRTAAALASTRARWRLRLER